MDKAYLVTGASGGVGQAVVKEFSLHNKKLVILGRSEDKLRKLKAETPHIKACITYDLENVSNIETIFQECASQGIQLQGLIHCAGINQGMPLKINDVAAMDRMMRINLYSFIELGKFFTKKKYTSENSSIVAISSMAAMENAKGMCMYSASKAALNSVVKTMAKELLSRRIRVNAILPGYLEKSMKEEKRYLKEEELKRIQPFGLIRCSDIAKLIAFLVSEDANYITGALIPIGGGQI